MSQNDPVTNAVAPLAAHCAKLLQMRSLEVPESADPAWKLAHAFLIDAQEQLARSYAAHLVRQSGDPSKLLRIVR